MSEGHWVFQICYKVTLSVINSCKKKLDAIFLWASLLYKKRAAANTKILMTRKGSWSQKHSNVQDDNTFTILCNLNNGLKDFTIT